MTSQSITNNRSFRGAVRGLLDGDFSRLESLFEGEILRWYHQKYFDREPEALAEALTCACFLGRTPLVELLLNNGVGLGAKTGLNGFHWAANRGQLDTVKLLIERQMPLETKNSYGGTVLGTAVWSAINEPRPAHLAIIEALIEAGARLDAAGYPTGNERVDEVLRRYGARPQERTDFER